jgi:hypothetical protein
MKLLLHLALALTLPACLNAWPVGGPWACSSGATCPTGYACDDGLCCKPGGTPACPTLPAPNGTCADGGQATLFFEDKDHDGDGNPRVVAVRCAAPLDGGVATTGTDCDDTDPAIHLGSPEFCNGRDDNCDNRVDEGLTPQRDFFLDSDGDGYGQETARLSACAAPPGYVAVGGDCAPFDPAKHPNAPELCDSADGDCDGVLDRDEPSLADVGDTFPCATGLKGVCAEGTFRCAPQPDGGVSRTCTALRTPSREWCDGLDNDCDGTADEPPDCGGPTSLRSSPDVVLSAEHITSPATIGIRCQLGHAGNTTETASGAQWTSGSSGFQVWSIAPADGGTWDLSNPNATLRIAFTATADGGTLDAGSWGDPVTPPRASLNPVVHLCGVTSDEIMRYRLLAATDGFRMNDTAFDRSLELKAVGSGWIVGQGSGFDTTRVRRVELIVQSFANSFTITFTPDAGFGR